jgi:hypothetical protein
VKVEVFWNVTLRHWVNDFYLPKDAAEYPRRLESSATLLWESQYFACHKPFPTNRPLEKCSPNQWTSRLLWKVKIRYTYLKRPPMVPTLYHILVSSYSDTFLRLSTRSMVKTPELCLPLKFFAYSFLYVFVLFHMCHSKYSFIFRFLPFSPISFCCLRFLLLYILYLH